MSVLSTELFRALCNVAEPRFGTSPSARRVLGGLPVRIVTLGVVVTQVYIYAQRVSCFRAPTNCSTELLPHES